MQSLLASIKLRGYTTLKESRVGTPVAPEGENVTWTQIVKLILSNPQSWAVVMVGFLVWKQNELIFELMRRLDLLTAAIYELQRLMK